MDGRRRRIARIAFVAAWFVALGLALKAGSTAPETGPEHLIALLSMAYLAAWGPFFLLSGRGSAARAARFAACSASLHLGLSLFELPAAVGLIDYRTVFRTPTPAWKRPGNRPDPDLVFVREGHRRDRLRFLGADRNRLRGATSPGPVYECDLKTDRNGFRNPVDLARADVVILGDSFIEGLQVAAPDLVSARLADRLGCTVANLGRTGYGPQQEGHVLRRFGLGLYPKTCVWAFYEGNDLQDVAMYDADRSRAGRARPESTTSAWYTRSLIRNGLACLIRTRIHPEPTLLATRHAGRFAGRSDVYFSCGVHEGETLPEDRETSKELARFRSILAEARDACDRAGVDLVVAFVPAKFRVYRDFCTFGPDSPCRDWPIDNLPAAVGQAVAAVSPEVGFLDLTPRFRAEAAAGAMPYLADDTHWSAEGQQAAAQALGDYLAGRPDRDQATTRARLVREVPDRR